MEALTNFCWLCEDPQKLVVPLEMRGQQGVYNLTNRMLEVAPKALKQVHAPIPVTFPLVDPSDPLSLQPGCLQRVQNLPAKPSVQNSSPKLAASIAGAQAAASQFRRQGGDRVNPQGPRFSSPGSISTPHCAVLYILSRKDNSGFMIMQAAGV